MSFPIETDIFGDPVEPIAQATLPAADAPLAARMRPITLDEYIGQEHIVGPGTLLRRAIETDALPSAIFWGPPGTGKSTLASVIARTTKSAFENYSAVTSGVADIRKVMDRSRERKLKLGRKTILFVDEIHRWNKSQQDALLPHVEDGTIILIGATTENPYFEINGPLISRARIFQFQPLPVDAIGLLVDRALADGDRGLGATDYSLTSDARNHLLFLCAGDARAALNALEAAAHYVQSNPERTDHTIQLDDVEQAHQQAALKYDRKSDEHYDTISAFIKSVRGSDPDAAIYWLSKMILAGEDPKFIVRRLLILASEDIGNADPMALVVANSAAQAVMFVGLPEGQLILSQATIYLATAPKSNACTVAIGRAMDDIRKSGVAPVPLHLKDSHYAGAKNLGHGSGYLYPHDHPGNWVQQEYMPDSAKSGPYYEPSANGFEAKIRARQFVISSSKPQREQS